MTAALDDAVARGRRLGVALSDEEIRRIGEHLGRTPTDTELFAFDAQWSEHCSYKSSREHLRKLPTDTELFAFDAQWSEHCSYKSSRQHLKKLPTQGPTVLLGVGGEHHAARVGLQQQDTAEHDRVVERERLRAAQRQFIGSRVV
ncbi:MAG: hypothetical protein JO103_05335, partial [Candidatus Eremiobacteraeota bacterium]|nr:hypothetical protein [Candidatus Eremiobacteraeota bacterium]